MAGRHETGPVVLGDDASGSLSPTPIRDVLLGLLSGDRHDRALQYVGGASWSAAALPGFLAKYGEDFQACVNFTKWADHLHAVLLNPDPYPLFRTIKGCAEEGQSPLVNRIIADNPAAQRLLKMAEDIAHLASDLYSSSDLDPGRVRRDFQRTGMAAELRIRLFSDIAARAQQQFTMLLVQPAEIQPPIISAPERKADIVARILERRAEIQPLNDRVAELTVAQLDDARKLRSGKKAWSYRRIGDLLGWDNTVLRRRLDPTAAEKLRDHQREVRALGRAALQELEQDDE